MPIRSVLDSHVHVWELAGLRPDWLDDVPALDRDFTSEDYVRALPELEELRAVYLEIDVPPSLRRDEFERVRALFADPAAPFVAAVLAGDPADPGLEEWLVETGDEARIRGFRQVLHVPDRPRGTCLSPEFVSGVRRIGETDRHFELCMRMEELPDATELAIAAPDTTLVLDHLGNPRLDGRDLDGWREDLSCLAERPNVLCKVSGLFQNATPDWSLDQVAGVIEHARGCFGIERLMFGGNWPVCTLLDGLGAWLEVVDAVTREWGARQREDLLVRNAERVYRTG